MDDAAGAASLAGPLLLVLLQLEHAAQAVASVSPNKPIGRIIGLPRKYRRKGL